MRCVFLKASWAMEVYDILKDPHGPKSTELVWDGVNLRFP